jgi:hypothetical protein
MIQLSRRALLIGATAGTVAAGFPGVIVFLGWSRMIHAFAAPLGRLSYVQPAVREEKVRQGGDAPEVRLVDHRRPSRHAAIANHRQ